MVERNTIEKIFDVGRRASEFSDYIKGMRQLDAHDMLKKVQDVKRSLNELEQLLEPIAASQDDQSQAPRTGEELRAKEPIIQEQQNNVTTSTAGRVSETRRTQERSIVETAKVEWNRSGQYAPKKEDKKKVYYYCKHRCAAGCQAQKHVITRKDSTEIIEVNYLHGHTCGAYDNEGVETAAGADNIGGQETSATLEGDAGPVINEEETYFDYKGYEEENLHLESP